MANNQNQHYVPKVYLKAFSPDGSDGKRLHLFNLARGQAILNAPIRGQCSRDYFYGQAPEVEEVFRETEGLYGSILRRLAEHDTEITPILAPLRDIAYLQLVRTDKALGTAKHYFETTHNLAYAGRIVPPKDELPPDWVMASDAVEHWRNTVDRLDDLAAAVVVNDTPSRFITSDNPAVLTNRLYCQKMRRTDFGVGNAGAILFLPLTPRLGFIAWDRHSYQPAGRVGARIKLRRSADVAALNALQVLNCRANLYFSEAEDVDALAKVARTAQPSRVSDPHAFSVWVPDEIESDGIERFRRASDTEASQNARRMILAANVHAVPSAWPSFLPFRRPVTAWVSVTAMGAMRESFAATRADLNLVKRRF